MDPVCRCAQSREGNKHDNQLLKQYDKVTKFIII